MIAGKKSRGHFILTIAPSTLDALTRDYLFRRVRALLAERCADPAVRALAADAAACDAFWAPHYAAMTGATEHGAAVRLAYLLAARALALNPGLAETAGDAAEMAMKARLEEKNVLPFAAFD